MLAATLPQAKRYDDDGNEIPNAPLQPNYYATDYLRPERVEVKLEPTKINGEAFLLCQRCKLLVERAEKAKL